MTGSLPLTDLVLVIRMLAILALGSWAARPLADRLMPEGGWIGAILLAWVGLGWVPWALAALHLLPFQTAAFAGVAVLLGLRTVLRPAGSPATLRGAVWAGAALAGLFWLGLAQRLGQAALSGLEKFTDMGLLAAVMRADTMPPPDAWYAGETINYYYVGHAIAGTWGHLAGARPDQTYQIAMAMLFALTGLAAWRITTSLAHPAGRVGAPLLGGLAALLTLYGGNLHATLYQWFRGAFPASRPDYYFADSTRFIGFDPDVPDKGFTEFPAYAFSVGDLHAHVVALPVFFLGVMILLAMLKRGAGGQTPDLAQAAGLGWVLGLCASINSWDVAILGLLGVLVWGLLALRPGTPLPRRLDTLAAAGLTVGAAAFVTAAPFLGWFVPFVNGIQRAPDTTPIWQLLVLYGHALLPLILYAAILWRVPEARRHQAIGVLFLGALGLLVVPELVIVRDIYGLEYARANTMFKLSFRAQTLLIIASVAALSLAAGRGRAVRMGAVLAALPLVSLLSYMPHVFIPPASIRSLDGLAFLGAERDLIQAAGRLPLEPGQSIVEASGPAFGPTARVSAMTGQPAVVGWAAHEWLWRNDPHHPNRRADLVRAFFTTQDAALRCAIVRRFRIRYAILGQVERDTYAADLNADGVRAMGPVIHADAGGEIVAVDPAVCR